CFTRDVAGQESREIEKGHACNAANDQTRYQTLEASVRATFFVSCETQKEIDCFWEKLSAGGEKSRCGSLKDKFGVLWQIVPPILGELLNDEDDAKSKRVVQAMLKMDKLDIKKLNLAYGKK